MENEKKKRLTDSLEILEKEYLDGFDKEDWNNTMLEFREMLDKMDDDLYNLDVNDYFITCPGCGRGLTELDYIKYETKSYDVHLSHDIAIGTHENRGQANENVDYGICRCAFCGYILDKLDGEDGRLIVEFNQMMKHVDNIIFSP